MLVQNANNTLTESPAKIDQDSIAGQFTIHRERLVRTARYRIDPRLLGRVDPEDVVQQSYLECLKRLKHFHHGISLFVQIRQLLLQTITDIHRRHLLTKARSVTCEVPMRVPAGAYSKSSITLTRILQDRIASPSAEMHRTENNLKLSEAIQSLNEIDCEVLLMRHFEDMTNAEVAQSLSIKPVTASQRYLRALSRLKDVLESDSHFSS